MVITPPTPLNSLVFYEVPAATMSGVGNAKKQAQLITKHSSDFSDKGRTIKELVDGILDLNEALK